MEYIRSGLPRLAEIFGPAEAAHLGRVTGRLVGAQLYTETAALLEVAPGGAPAFGAFMAGLAAGEGDAATVSHEGDAVLVRRDGWRLMRGLGAAVAGRLRGLERTAGGRARRARPLPGARGPLPPRLGRRGLHLAHPPPHALIALFAAAATTGTACWLGV